MEIRIILISILTIKFSFIIFTVFTSINHIDFSSFTLIPSDDLVRNSFNDILSNNKLLLLGQLYLDILLNNKEIAYILQLLFDLGLVIFLIFISKKTKFGISSIWIYIFNPLIMLYYPVLDEFWLIILILGMFFLLHKNVPFLAWIPIALASFTSIIAVIYSIFFVRRINIFYILVICVIILPILHPIYQDYLIGYLIEGNNIQNIVSFIFSVEIFKIENLIKIFILISVILSIIFIEKLENLIFISSLILIVLFPDRFIQITLIMIPVLVFKQSIVIMLFSFIAVFFVFFQVETYEIGIDIIRLVSISSIIFVIIMQLIKWWQNRSLRNSI